MGSKNAKTAVSVARRGFKDSLLWVSIDNPPVNALTAQVRAELIQAAAIAHERNVHVVVLLGNQHCFSAGGYIDELAGLDSDERSAAVHEEYLELYRSWHDIPVPTIVGIRGYALGGALELALSCDLRYATADAFFTASGVKMGLVESAHTLPRVVCDAVAAEMLFTATRVDAFQAVTIGLLNRVVDDLEAHVAAVADAIAAHPTEAVRATKAVFRTAQGPGRATAEEVAIRHWRELQRGHAHKSLARAFLDRRKR